MKLRLLLVMISALFFPGCKSQGIIKMEMHLSAFGVESDRYPNIEATIDFENGTSLCKVSYYDPQYKPFQYVLSNKEMEILLNILENTSFDGLKKEYTSNITDQPTSAIKINTTDKVYSITDYGLKGDAPLPEIYRIVYKPDLTVK